MTLRTKKLIAREGLIILGIISASILLGYLAYRCFWSNIFSTIPPGDLVYYGWSSGKSLSGAIGFHVIFLYTIYLSGWSIYFIIRFIFWAIKTLGK